MRWCTRYSWDWYDHACVAKSDGSAWCWGWGNNGQIGNNTSGNSYTVSTPQRVKDSDGTTNLANVTSIATGTLESCAIISGSTLKCWGVNMGGLGDNTTTLRAVATSVAGIGGIGTLSSVASVAIGLSWYDGGYGYAGAILSDGTGLSWGYGGTGNLGDGTTNSRYAPAGMRW